MASGTKHFCFNRPKDWLVHGAADHLSAQEDGLILRDAGKGLYTSFALDTLEYGTVWHRLRMTSGIPANTQVRLYLYCSDCLEMPSFPGREGGACLVDDWLKQASPQQREDFFMACAPRTTDDPRDLTLYEFCGRYLWFCLVFFSYSGQMPSVQSIKLEFPRVAFIDYLPQVYRGADSINSFLARFISVFQSVYVDLEDDIDHLPRRCDPTVAPAEFLDWLADCLSVSNRFLWSETRLREFLKQAVELYRINGTKEALRQVIRLYTGQEARIIEQFEPAATQSWRRDEQTLGRLYGSNPYTFTVLLPSVPENPDAYAKLWKIIEVFKPVDAICNLAFLDQTMILGQHCYLEMNSRIGGSRNLVLDGAAGSGGRYLTEHDSGGTMDE